MAAFLQQYWYVIAGVILGAIFVAAQYRRRSRAEASGTKANNGVGEMPTLWEWCLFAGLAAVFWIDRDWGYRALGLVTAGYGVPIVLTRRVAYGIEGRSPSGYVTGGLAVIYGLLQTAFGVVLMFAPNMVIGLLGSHAA